MRRPFHQLASLLPYGIATVRVPEHIREKLGDLRGLEQGKLIPLAIECDDLNVLKTVSMTTDTVLACPDAGAVQEVKNVQLVRLDVSDLPPIFNDIGLFSLKGRSHSPMAQFAVDYFIRVGAEQAALI